jgi:hypothetical protein
LYLTLYPFSNSTIIDYQRKKEQYISEKKRQINNRNEGRIKKNMKERAQDIIIPSVKKKKKS